jgi:Ca2+-binding EF-hand superfamily protein
LAYTGCQLLSNARPSTARPNSTTVRSTIATEKWENNIIEKLKSLLKCSTRPLKEIFAQFNPDGDNFITQNEFRSAIRQLNLGLSSREIDQLMVRIDANRDGMIDFNEFAAKFAVGNQD